MILNILGQILGLVAITFFGLLVVNLFMSKVHIFERVSLGFLVGLGIFTFVLFLANWFLAVPFEIFPVVAILFWLIILFGFINLLFRRKLSYKFNFIEWYRSLSGIEKGIALLIGFILFSVFVSDLYWPIWMWDAIALYDYRAKNMVLLGRIVGSFSVSSGTYPLLTSMSHGIIYLFGGTNPQYLYFLFLLSLSVIFYFFLRRFLVRKYSLISLLFLISIPLLTQQAQVALTDLPQSAYLVPAFLYLILGLSEENKSYIIFSGIFFTLSTWVRNEPFWMVGLFVLFIFSYKQKWFLLDGLYYIIVHIVSNIWNNFIVGHLPEVLKVETAKVNFFSDYSTTLFRSNYWITVISFIFNNVLFFIPISFLFINTIQCLHTFIIQP